MFILQDKIIDTAQAKRQASDISFGALVTFEGVVRNDQHQDTRVSSLMYIADSDECIKQGDQIIQEAYKHFSIRKAVCIQRIGQVPAGESATWIGVWAEHRDEAFKGCRYIIEETKQRLLIWKKEHFINGTSAWVRKTNTTVNL